MTMSLDAQLVGELHKFKFDDWYRVILKLYAEREKTKNKRSLRNLAGTLNMPASTLSNVIKRRFHLSIDRTVILSEQLDFDEEVRRLFVLSSKVSRADSVQIRRSLESKIRDILSQQDRVIDAAAFEVMSHWIYFALLTFLKIRDHCYPSDLEKYFSLDKTTCRAYLERLLGLSLVQIDQLGRVSASVSNTIYEPKQRSAAVRQYYRSLWLKASDCLEKQEIEQRVFRSLTLRLRANDLPRFEGRLKEFFRSINEEFDSEQADARVYNLGTHLVSLENMF